MCLAFSARFVLCRAAAAVVVWDLGKINSFPSQKECNYSSIVCGAVEYKDGNAACLLGSQRARFRIRIQVNCTVQANVRNTIKRITSRNSFSGCWRFHSF